jgi:hypothetical protein
MDLLKILRSFEEFLFEVMTWLYFYPRTLWRIVSRPMATMAYADAEGAEPEDNRFDDSLSPPVLLLISLVLANAVGWAAHIPKPAAASRIVEGLFNSPQNLLLFRCLIFSLIPLLAALSLLRRQGVSVSRNSLREPFYAQCYLAAPFALVESLGAIAMERGGPAYASVGLFLVVLGVVWLLAVQARWFRDRLKVGLLAAIGLSVSAFVRSIICMLAIVIPVALI